MLLMTRYLRWRRACRSLFSFVGLCAFARILFLSQPLTEPVFIHVRRSFEYEMILL